MSHVAPGSLRRALDEAGSLTADQRRHLGGCTVCRARSASLAAVAARTAHAFAVAPLPSASLEAARARVTRRLAPRPVMARGSERRTRAFATLWLSAVAACAALAIGFPPLRTVASDFLSVFAPSAVAPIALDPHDVQTLRSLPGLAAYGTMHARVDALVYAVPNLRQAELAVDFPVRTPAYVPAAAPAVPQFVVGGRTVTDFTFGSARAQRSAVAAGTLAPPMPPQLDGSTLEAGFGPTVVTTYVAPGDRAVRPDDLFALATGTSRLPALAIVQLPVPKISSTGASETDIEAYLFSQPGMSPHLAAQLAALGDLTTTLPVPVPLDRAFARSAIVRGRAGITFGDETGGFAGAVWQEDGMLYAVYGTLPLHEISAVSNSLR